MTVRAGVCAALCLAALLDPVESLAQAESDSASTSDSTAVSSGAAAIPDSLLYVLPEFRLVEPYRVEASPWTWDERQAVTRTRLEKEEISRYQPLTVADALASVPGVETVKTGGWSARPAVRGLSGDRILVSVDGVRMNQVRGHGAEPSLIPVDQLESVEVSSGPGGSHQGSSAMGGSINLVTRRPLIELGETLEFTGSIRGTDPGAGRYVSGSARYSSLHFGAEVGGGAGKLRSLVTPNGELGNSGNDEYHGFARIAAMRGPLLTDLQYFRSEATDIGLPAFQTPTGGAGEYPLKSRETLRFETTLEQTSGIPATSILVDWQRYKSHFDETAVDSLFNNRNYIGLRTTDARDRIQSRSTGVRTEHQHSWLPGIRFGTELRFERSFGPRETEAVITGTEGDIRSVTEELTESMPNSTRWSGALSLQAQRDFGRWSLEGGARWDSFDSEADSSVLRQRPSESRSESKANGEIGLSFQGSHVQPFARVASAFRAPALDERYYDGFVHGALYLFGNPDLRPESALSTELGFRLRNLGPLESAQFSAYRSEVDDLITFQFSSTLYAIPRFQYRNVENARLDGVEGSASFRAGAFGLTLSGNVPRGEDLDTGDRIPDTGVSRASAEGSWTYEPGRLWWQRSRLSARWSWADALEDVDDSLSKPSFWTIDVDLAAQVRPGTEIQFAVRNVLDESYEQPLSFIAEPGRTWSLALRHAFRLDLNRVNKENTP